MKECTKCKKEKAFSEYHNQKGGKDGLRSVCKICTNAQSKISKAKNPDYKKNGREAKRRKYQNDEVYREIIKRRTKEYTKKRYKFASQSVYQAIKKGILPHISTLTCVNCKSQATQYHHPHGYDKDNALNVVPVCNTCHGLVHSS